MELAVKTLDGGEAGSISLSDEVFGLEPRADILHRMVRYQLAKRRAGTHKTKGRAEIARTGAKMFKQKGTGRARHGSARVGVFRGGGKAHGPQVRDHGHDLPKKVRALALRHALSSKVKDENLLILDNVELEQFKTKGLREKLDKLGLKNALVIDGLEVNSNFEMAARNVTSVDVLPVQGLNVYDILRRDMLVLTRAAVDALEARFK